MKDNKDSKTLDMFDYGDSEYDNHEATEERLDNYGHSYKEWGWSEKRKLSFLIRILSRRQKRIMKVIKILLAIILTSPLWLSMILFQVIIGLVCISISPFLLTIATGLRLVDGDWGYLKTTFDFATFPLQLLGKLMGDILNV